jgi:two-component SAPR family response regulator
VDLEENSLPQWIFLDINMPLWMVGNFRLRFQLVSFKTKIYLLSSSIDKHDLDRASANPYVFDYLVKPLNDAQLEGIGLSV